MLIEEILPLNWQPFMGDTRSPDAVVAAELARRNRDSSLRYHVKAFGPIVGPQVMDTQTPDRHLLLLRLRGAL